MGTKWRDLTVQECNKIITIFGDDDDNTNDSASRRNMALPSLGRKMSVLIKFNVY
jgi:hypothetical protein